MQIRKQTFTPSEISFCRNNKITGRGNIILYFFKGVAYYGFISYFFFKDIRLNILISVVLSFFNIKNEIRSRMNNLKDRINIEFKDGLEAIKGALSAGYSFENSFNEAVKSLKVIYGDNSLIIPYFDDINKKISLNIPVENALKDFSCETEIEEVVNFSEVINIAKRTGGDLINIAKDTTERIRNNIDVKMQIKTMIAGKRLECLIMNYIPVIMILYLWIFSPGFLDCMYEGLSSKVFMGVLFILYMIFKKISEKITEVSMW